MTSKNEAPDRWHGSGAGNGEWQSIHSSSPYPTTTAHVNGNADSEALEVLRSAGLSVESIDFDGKLHRVPTADKPGSRNGAYIAHADPPVAVWCRNWATGEECTWTAKAEKKLTVEERKTLARRKEETRRERDAEQARVHAEAADRAQGIYAGAEDCAEHPYLTAKGLKSMPGVRVHKGALVVPVHGEDGKIATLQFIDVEGGKRFLSDGRKRGCCFPIGKIRGAADRVLLGEGLATVAAAVGATGLPGVVAFDAGNLAAAGRTVKQLAPDARLVFLADDDRKVGQTANPGIEAAEQAARETGGCVAYPAMDRKADFWDLWNEQGPEAVQAAIDAAVPMRLAEISETNSPPPERPAEPPRAKIRPLDIRQILSIEIPPRENLLNPWLSAQSLVMIYAYRGIGKTLFGLDVAYAVASGGKYLNWEAPKAAGILYLDGEMPFVLMQERIAGIVKSSTLEPTEPFLLLNQEMLPPGEGMPRIDTLDGQRIIDEILLENPGVKLIVVDNISTLSQAKENDADGWTPVQMWALRQRAAGRSVLFIHHAGKGGQQRGTSRREDVLDCVLALRRPVDYRDEQGAVFEIYFEKARGIYGDDVKPIEARLTVGENKSNTWAVRTVETGTFERVVQLYNDGLTPGEIALELGIHKSSVSRHIKRAKTDGLVKNLIETREGSKGAL